MIDYKGIGIRIRDMRKMRKMTQEQLAEGQSQILCKVHSGRE